MIKVKLMQMRFFELLLKVIVSFLISSAVYAEAPSSEKSVGLGQKKLKKALLIGGGLKICSSYSKKYCKQAKTFAEDAYVNDKYRVTEDKIVRLKEDAFDVFADKDRKQNVIELLSKFILRNGQDVLTRAALLSKLDSLSLSSTSISGFEVLKRLSPVEMRLVLQTLQEPVIGKKNHPLTEYVFLEQSDVSSKLIVERFVELVKQTSQRSKPLILFSTASSNDVFNAVSFYYQLFNNDSVQVAWLPVEASLNQLLNENSDCEQLARIRAQSFGVYERERVYPQLAEYQRKFCENPKLFESLVEQADGIFFNGGDQFLTLSAFAKISDKEKNFGSVYQKLKSRFEQGKLVIAGTSAGTAVQSGGVYQNKSIPMVTNGASLNGFIDGSVNVIAPPSSQCEFENSCEKGTGLDSLTRLDLGGFDLISIGLFDTHFSERDRAFRLMRLMSDTDTSLGFGIDENTALELQVGEERQRLATHGEGASWIFEMQQNSKNFRTYSLWHGEQGAIEKGVFQLEEDNTNWERLATRDDIVSKIAAQLYSRNKKKISYTFKNRKVNFNSLDSEDNSISRNTLVEIDAN